MKLYVIDWIDIEAAKEYFVVLEGRILAKSNHHNLMHKFTTGFGWLRNLSALNSNQLVSSILAENIIQSHYFFSNLSTGQKISVDTWNDYVMMQNKIIDGLALK